MIVDVLPPILQNEMPLHLNCEGAVISIYRQSVFLRKNLLQEVMHFLIIIQRDDIYIKNRLILYCLTLIYSKIRTKNTNKSCIHIFFSNNYRT